MRSSSWTLVLIAGVAGSLTGPAAHAAAVVPPAGPLASPPAQARSLAPTPQPATGAKRRAPGASARGKASAKSAAKAKKVPRWPIIVLFHVNRRETLSLRLADAQGRPVKGVQKRIERFLRCHMTGKQHAMNPRLTRLIYETGRHYYGRRIEVVSGYRHPSVAKNPRSPHMKGLACDMRVAGVKNTELRDYFRNAFKSVGVGYYPNSSFVHLDVRKGASAFWIDYSGPKEKAIYADNPYDDLRSGRADSWKPTKIDPAWADEDGGGAGSATPGAPQRAREADEAEGEDGEEREGPAEGALAAPAATDKAAPAAPAPGPAGPAQARPQGSSPEAAAAPRPAAIATDGAGVKGAPASP